MNGTAPGRIAALWRYPVKSLLGEPVDELRLDARGAEGDRLWAVRDEAGKLGSGKHTRRFRRMDGLFALASRLEGDVPTIDFPDGRRLRGDDPAIDGALSGHVGFPVTLVREAQVRHHDAGPIHLITTSSLRSLGRLLGGGPVDARRFRANLVIETADEGFPEEDWIGRTLAVGEVRLRIVAPTERCAMVGFAQAELPEAPEMLRALAGERGARLGVYAEVCAGGSLRRGESLSVD